MKITDVKTWAVGNPDFYRGGTSWIFVKLTTDNAISGYGEVYGVLFAPRAVCQMIEDVVARHVVGRCPFDIENIWRILFSSGFNQRPDVSRGGVMSGIEIACWDIVGKALNQPINNLRGGKVHERLRSYTYLYPAMLYEEMDPAAFHGGPDAAPAQLQRYMDTGFTAVGFDPVMLMGSFDPRQLSLDALDGAEKLTAALREVTGSTCDLMFKTHGQMTTSSAIRLAKRLKKFDPLWFEEPLPPSNPKEMARVAASTSIPISGGSASSAAIRIRRCSKLRRSRSRPWPRRRHHGRQEDLRHGRGALRAIRTAFVCRTHRGDCQHPVVRLAAELPDPRKHRNLWPPLFFAAEQTDRVGRWIRDCAQQTGPWL